MNPRREILSKSFADLSYQVILYILQEYHEFTIDSSNSKEITVYSFYGFFRHDFTRKPFPFFSSICLRFNLANYERKIPFKFLKYLEVAFGVEFELSILSKCQRLKRYDPALLPISEIDVEENLPQSLEHLKFHSKKEISNTTISNIEKYKELKTLEIYSNKYNLCGKLEIKNIHSLCFHCSLQMSWNPEISRRIGITAFNIPHLRTFEITAKVTLGNKFFVPLCRDLPNLENLQLRYCRFAEDEKNHTRIGICEAFMNVFSDLSRLKTLDFRRSEFSYSQFINEFRRRYDPERSQLKEINFSEVADLDKTCNYPLTVEKLENKVIQYLRKSLLFEGIVFTTFVDMNTFEYSLRKEESKWKIYKRRFGTEIKEVEIERKNEDRLDEELVKRNPFHVSVN